MYKNIIVDISGKVPLYDHALCTALESEYSGTIVLATPFQQDCYSPKYKVCRLLRLKRKNGGKMLKAIEGLINYCYLTIKVLLNKYEVIHFQWLPFLEYASFERYFLSLLKLFSPKSKIILTQHNIYPHNSSELKKKNYRTKMGKINKVVDKFVVHTESSKGALIEEFGISCFKIEVIYHGIFKPDHLPIKNSSDIKTKFLMFGIQSYYKGTDLLVKAVSSLPKDIRDKIEVTIAGKTDDFLYNDNINLANQAGIKWDSRYYTDKELNQLIMDSDVLVFPYRNISQSGALLLALAFGKPMIVSKLSSFIETLDGFPEDAFIDVDSVESLKNAIIVHIDKKQTVFSQEINVISELQKKYSWNNSAKKTIRLYNSLSNNKL